MRTAGIRELKSRTRQVLQEISKTGEEAVIVVNGEQVARLIPTTRRMSQKELQDWNERVDKLAARIATLWSGPLDAGQLMQEERER